MQRALDETNRRRAKQVEFNTAEGITPKGVTKRIKDMIDGVYDAQAAHQQLKAAQSEAAYESMDEAALAREIRRLEKEMFEYARNLEFEQAASARDQLRELKERLFGVNKNDGVAGEQPAARPRPAPVKAPRRAGGRR
jgi:excinuclease ABC subunit B